MTLILYLKMFYIGFKMSNLFKFFFFGYFDTHTPLFTASEDQTLDLMKIMRQVMPLGQRPLVVQIFKKGRMVRVFREKIGASFNSLIREVPNWPNYLKFENEPAKKLSLPVLAVPHEIFFVGPPPMLLLLPSSKFNVCHVFILILLVQFTLCPSKINILHFYTY